MALSLSNLATVLVDLGKASEARPLLERAVAILDKTLPPEHPWRIGAHKNLAFSRPLEPPHRRK